ncbi:MAG: alkaline phosphatase [Bacteroidota bacterium]
MKRRNFFRSTSLTAAGLAVSPLIIGQGKNREALYDELKSEAKNIIFLVSDGMSTGTLTMADLFFQRMNGRQTHWIENLSNGTFRRGLMDTASASSLVTDSAAGGSAWGGGKRVPNGSLNVGENGEQYTPILQKFKAQKKSVGCVTTVPITHATPASFCVNMASRNDQAGIAERYLDLRFDVMMGGGHEYFSSSEREDQKDLYGAFKEAGFAVAKSKNELRQVMDTEQPLLGVFNQSALPFTVDQVNDEKLQKTMPSLPEMTAVAIEKMKKNDAGFALQVEAGKVDWAAHSNDTGGLIYDQVTFDDAVRVALDFAREDGNTLVVVTTDHGNANPGLFYGKNADAHFDRIKSFKHSNKWIMDGITKKTTPKMLIDLIEHAQGYKIAMEDAKLLINLIDPLDEEELYDDYKKPFAELAKIQKKHTAVGWADNHHSADYVEVAAYGPGSELLRPFIKNTYLHELMLVAAGVANTTD